jgi:nucleoside-diphosphate-sugar epimerase
MVELVRSGRFRWIGGGRHLTSTCHVDNCVHGLVLAADHGTPGAAYFVTDGPPVPFRGFASALLATQGVSAPTGTAPRWLVRALAALAGAGWRLLPLSGVPPLDPIALRVAGEVCTVRDEKARRELGYEGKVSRERGFAELQAGNTTDGGVPAARVPPGSSAQLAAAQAADADRRDLDAGGSPTR